MDYDMLFFYDFFLLCLNKGMKQAQHFVSSHIDTGYYAHEALAFILAMSVMISNFVFLFPLCHSCRPSWGSAKAHSPSSETKTG